ncbi:MAG TPA: hypothetical protein VJK51_01610 [Candidatus Nanoarchaeia archaeon]|nr:hypothetical protein [Candidatus Nanoarchaeia archaeon]
MFDSLYFDDFEQDPVFLAVIIFVLVFVILFSILTKSMKNKGIALLISFSAAGLAGWQLYQHRFYELEQPLIWIIGIVVVILFLKILWAFVRGLRR